MSTGRSAAGPTVLVVDDTAVNRSFLSALLRREGLQPVDVPDGESALRMAARVRPDLILLDVMMPGLDGFEICRRIKADAGLTATPIIFLTAMTDPEERLRAFELGAEDYVTKPFNGAEVMARVRTHLRLQGLLRELAERNRRLVEQQAALDEDLRAAAEIQRAIIPRHGNVAESVELAWVFEPCSRIGGDIFSAHRVGDRHLVLYVLDVNGHGVPPALLSTMVAQFLAPGSEAVCARGGSVDAVPHSPAEVLGALDREFPLSRFDRFLTMAYMILDLETGVLRYSSAGHPPPLVLRRDGTHRLLEEGGAIVGLGDGAYEEGECRLLPGDRLFAFSDGVTEREHARKGLFGVTRLRRTLEDANDRTLGEACRAVASALEEFAEGADAGDDVTLVGLEYRGRR